MKRTSQPTNNTATEPVANDTILQGNPIARSNLAKKIGMQYEGERDLYQALGYQSQITLTEYIQAYERQDIARKINDAPVQATWRGEVQITDSAEESEFDEAWDAVSKRLRIWNKISRLDRLVGLGQYAVLLLGFDDVVRDEDFKEPINENAVNLDLKYIYPYHQRNAQIEQYDTDPKSERYGMPIIYKIRVTGGQWQNDEQDLEVHYTRIIHVAEHLLENELFGLPRLKVVWNRLEDLMKIVGGSAEMFWRGARPGHAAKMDKDVEIGDTDKEEFQQQLSEFEHGMRRWLRLQGVDIQSLAPQVADPSSHVDVQISMIAAASGIPKRLLIGSERGELSSTQDESNWNQNIQDRREQYAETMILRPLIDRLISCGVLPQPDNEDYDVQWPDLWTPSEKEKADTASSVASALKAYTSAPGANTIVPERFFLRKVLGWPEEDVDAAMEEMKNMADTETAEEKADWDAIEETGGQQGGNQ